MTSIEEFRAFLSTEGRELLREIVANLKLLTYGRPYAEVQFSVKQQLNALYFELLDFITWLEQENKAIKSRNVKVLIDDLRKELGEIDEFQKIVSNLTSSSMFRDEEVFTAYRRKLIKKAENIAAEIIQYEEELDTLKGELTNISIPLKSADNFILAAPEIVGKIRQKIKILKVETFSNQKEELASSLQALSLQVDNHFKILQKLRKVSALTEVLAKLQVAQVNLKRLAKTVRKTDPKVWKQSSASFEIFKEHLLEDLEGILKTFAAIASDLEDVQKQLAA